MKTVINFNTSIKASVKVTFKTSSVIKNEKIKYFFLVENNSRIENTEKGLKQNWSSLRVDKYSSKNKKKEKDLRIKNIRVPSKKASKRYRILSNNYPRLKSKRQLEWNKLYILNSQKTFENMQNKITLLDNTEGLNNIGNTINKIDNLTTISKEDNYLRKPQYINTLYKDKEYAQINKEYITFINNKTNMQKHNTLKQFKKHENNGEINRQYISYAINAKKTSTIKKVITYTKTEVKSGKAYSNLISFGMPGYLVNINPKEKLLFKDMKTGDIEDNNKLLRKKDNIILPSNKLIDLTKNIAEAENCNYLKMLTKLDNTLRKESNKVIHFNKQTRELYNKQQIMFLSNKNQNVQIKENNLFLDKQGNKANDIENISTFVTNKDNKKVYILYENQITNLYLEKAKVYKMPGTFYNFKIEKQLRDIYNNIFLINHNYGLFKNKNTNNGISKINRVFTNSKYNTSISKIARVRRDTHTSKEGKGTIYFPDFQDLVFGDNMIIEDKAKYVKGLSDEGNQIVTLPLENPIDLYSDIAKDYLDVDVSIMQFAMNTMYSIWKENIYAYATSRADKSIESILKRTEKYIREKLSYDEEATKHIDKTLKLMGWLSEAAILSNSDYELTYVTEDGKIDYAHKNFGNLNKNILNIQNLEINDDYLLATKVPGTDSMFEFRVNQEYDIRMTFKAYMVHQGVLVITIGNKEYKYLGTEKVYHDIDVTIPKEVKKVSIVFYFDNEDSTIEIASFKVEKMFNVDFNIKYLGKLTNSNSIINKTLEVIQNTTDAIEDTVIGVPEDYVSKEDAITNSIQVSYMINSFIHYMYMHHNNKCKGKRLTIKKGEN